MTAFIDDPRSRAAAFCDRFGLRLPILLAPMAGACPPSLSIAVMRAGGFGACAALLMQPNEIEEWAAEVRANISGPFQINLWIPDPPPIRDRSHEARVREFLSRWGPPVPEEDGDMSPPKFEKQCQALLRIAPAAVSSIMGLYSPSFVAELKSRRIPWFATATTVAEAKQAEAATHGAPAGHRQHVRRHKEKPNERHAEECDRRLPMRKSTIRGTSVSQERLLLPLPYLPEKQWPTC